jgi:ATP-dependent Clp protease ATP-binding subunit ClpX
VNGTSIGFQANIKENKIEGDLSTVSPDDLTKYGMIPEFIGRFTTTVSIKELNKDQLIQILTDVKNNYVSQYKYLLKLDDIDLNFNKDALEEIAENTLTLKTGARGLHTEIERVLMCHMYHTKTYRQNKIKILNIDRDQVKNPKPINHEPRKTSTS